ncbi:MAG TPA: hypothetical protein VHU14_01965 [Solirubrobacterales bacterium]|nr:hypothetical protein [Solirubrobacterales bacterium]
MSLAIFTQFDPDHSYGKRTLRGVAARLLGGVERPADRGRLAGRARRG